MQTPSSKDILKTAQSLVYQGQFSGALAALSPLLEKEEKNVDALYLAAVCERYNQQHEAALKILTQLRELAPEFGRAYQEEGHIYRETGDHTKALKAYQNACKANPALTASWIAQGELLTAKGNASAAKQAFAQASRLAALPKELLAVTNFFHEEKLLKAEKLCRAFLKRNPKHVEGMRLLAAIAARFGVMDEADFLLESAATFEPNNIQVQLDHIEVLRKRQKFDSALNLARKLHEKEPNNPIFQSHFAIENLQAGNFEVAVKTFDEILAALPTDPATLTSKGHALKTIGKQEAAIESYKAAYDANPDHADAYYALANLKTYRFTDRELEDMRERAHAETTPYEAQIQFNFALGKAYEDRKDYQLSFTHYERGNTLKKGLCRYDSDQMQDELLAQADFCTEELFTRNQGCGHSAPDPIFIVGLPRAGSTLLEQILASHSQVEGTMELPNILSLSHKLRAGRTIRAEEGYPSNLHKLPPEQLEAFGRLYIDETRIHRSQTPYFIDKMPNNFRHIGLIQLILPNAKIIDARRDPMDCCFSGFKQLFAEGQEFTYGLEEIGRYYAGYVNLMDHWDTVLPGKILRVQYEDVIADLEGQVRRILDHCGLPFEEACLEFHKTDRAVRTASSEQVREKINTKGLEQWRPYEPWLGPLVDALKSAE